MMRKWFQKSNAVVISNGIDAERFVHLHIDKPPLFTCAFVGRLSEEKNPLFLIDLAKSLLPGHNFVFRVAGEGPLRKDLEQRIAEEKLEEHFVIHGHVDDIPALLAESHCLLIPSHWEGMPLVLLEAGAAGIPVIATPVGNIPAIVTPGSGYIGDTKSFKAMIEEVMDNYGDALVKARTLMHAVIDNYSIANVYLKYREIYL
jgi:glycosyltransferase involved in cell wall biosynthesis